MIDGANPPRKLVHPCPVRSTAVGPEHHENTFKRRRPGGIGRRRRLKQTGDYKKKRSAPKNRSSGPRKRPFIVFPTSGIFQDLRAALVVENRDFSEAEVRTFRATFQLGSLHTASRYESLPADLLEAGRGTRVEGIARARRAPLQYAAGGRTATAGAAFTLLPLIWNEN
ncbi:hypothetical protein EVAR_43035_1 [Eumeta japonica]|uniref:Uncharacterized protein n=1 Tax=Eumeta variegata TaxID=151549 RepID=A0A4C1XP64_EUMVA|nr:hypothetical protein EVAR_43035_1 [Eumeta japonica]